MDGIKQEEYIQLVECPPEDFTIPESHETLSIFNRKCAQKLFNFRENWFRNKFYKNFNKKKLRRYKRSQRPYICVELPCKIDNPDRVVSVMDKIMFNLELEKTPNFYPFKSSRRSR